MDGVGVDEADDLGEDGRRDVLDDEEIDVAAAAVVVVVVVGAAPFLLAEVVAEQAGEVVAAAGEEHFVAAELDAVHGKAHVRKTAMHDQ